MTLESELLAKLFNTYHLNVEERKELPGGVVRASVAKNLIRSELSKVGWFPGVKQKPTNDAGGEYLQLESRDDGTAFLHINTESGLLRFSHYVEEFKSAEQAVNEYLKKMELDGLDGLIIDWTK